MPRWVRVPVGLFTAALLAPFLIIVLLPILVVAPAALPFVASVFIGDLREEETAAREVVRRISRPPRSAFAVAHGMRAARA